MFGDWRFLAQRFSTGEWLSTELDLANPSVEYDVLSGPTRISGELAPALAKYKADDGLPLFLEWDTIIYAEAGGEIRTAGIVADVSYEVDKYRLDCMGLAGLPAGQPYRGEQKYIDTDPLDIVRHLWAHLQEDPQADLGVIVDSTATPVRVGMSETIPDLSTGLGEPIYFEEGPVKLAWYLTEDIGKEIDDLAERTPFDYKLTSNWVDDWEVEHRLRFGYPRLGSRNDRVRFATGENIIEIPSITGADETIWANQIEVIGAGEGRDMVHASLPRSGDTRIRRVQRIVDKTIRTHAAAIARARLELAARQSTRNFDSITIVDHHNARIGSFEAGDEILVLVDTPWHSFEEWMRIMSISLAPTRGTATLSLVRADSAVVL